MTAIVYDYAAIATALRGDDWWVKAKIEPLPVDLPGRSLIDEMLRCGKMIDEVTGMLHLPPETKRDWRLHLLYQGKPII